MTVHFAHNRGGVYAGFGHLLAVSDCAKGGNSQGRHSRPDGTAQGHTQGDCAGYLGRGAPCMMQISSKPFCIVPLPGPN